MPSRELTIFRIHLKEALVAAKQGEGELAILYQEVANDVTAKVRDRGDQVSAVQLEGEINEAFEKIAFKRVKIVKASIENAAKLGPKASKKTMRAVYGEEVARAQVRSSKKALNEAAERIAGRTTVDGKSVSRRLRAIDKQVSSEMAREVERGVRQKKGILGAARQIEKLDPRDVKLPKYLQRVQAAARAGNLDELKGLTAHYTKHVQRMLGEHQADGSRIASKFSLRSETQRFLKDVEKSGPAGLDVIVNRYMEDKAAWRANVITRHETVEAYRRSYIEQSKNKPGVIGMQWRLSPTRHPVSDECDIYANQNAYKLGPGVYPVDKVPSDPHPLCLCSVTVVLDKHHFRRGQAENDNAVPPLPKDEKSPDALGWLKANDAAAAKILGPTRHALMKQGVNVLDGQGKPLLVRDLLGAQRQKMAVGAPPFAPPRPPAPARSSRQPGRQLPSTKKSKPTSKAARAEAGVSIPYGTAAPEVARASDVFEAATERTVRQVPRGVSVPLTEHLALAGETARNLERTLGLQQVRPVHTISSLDSDRYAGLMYWDGRMKLQLAGKDKATYRTLVHEVLHTFGGVHASGYRSIGAVIEESATEELADMYCGGTWKLARRGAKLDLADTEKAYANWLHRPHEWRCEGVYTDYRQRIMSIVGAATGEVDAETLSRRVRTAMTAWKRKSYNTASEAMAAFIDALEPTADQRRFYERAMSSPANWNVR